MSRLVAITAMLFAVLLISNSCMDEDPAEISIRTSQGGQPLNVNVMLFNEKGVQVQETYTDRGFVIVKALKPGTYFVKFKDRNDVIMPAVRKIEVAGGESKVIDVDVDDVSKNAADFPGTAAAPPAS